MTATNQVAVQKPPLKEVGSIAVFIDGPNLYFSARKARYELDYAALMAYLKQATSGEKLKVGYFSATWNLLSDPNHNHPYGRPEQLQYLERLGYEVVTKTAFESPLGEAQSNMDSEIVTEMVFAGLREARIIILFSADKGFRYTVERLENEGCQVFVVASQQSISRTYRAWLGERFYELGHLLSKLPETEKEAVS